MNLKVDSLKNKYPRILVLNTVKIGRIGLSRYAPLILSVTIAVLIARLAQFPGFGFTGKTRVTISVEKFQYVIPVLSILFLVIPAYYYDVLKEFFKKFFKSKAKARKIGLPNYIALFFFIAILALILLNPPYQKPSVKPGNYTEKIEEAENLTYIREAEEVETSPANQTLEISFSYTARRGGIEFPVMILLFLFVFMISFIAFKAFKEVSEEAVEEETEEVVDVIKKTLRDLEAGVESRSVIVRCFLELKEIVSSKGFRFKESMTIREVFEGIIRMFPEVPRTPLRRLARIFEKAVYSHYPISEYEERMALESLEELKTFFLGVAA
ncbi:MAG: hypothetical protein DRJ37_03350 [Thermoprotei archaeon]|nr:MAG: hypothetical protein DRJ37_03350 [Thermoprotei archaeon]